MTNFIPYMERTRNYYRAQGFERDYVWAQHDDTPFFALTKPLEDCRMTLVVTAVAHPEIPKPIRKAETIPFAEAPAAFDTDGLAWDRETTHTNDRRSYFPMEQLTLLAKGGLIGSLTSDFHFVPTEYSQRATIEEDAPQIAAACVADQVDIALLVPL
ncbi:MAG: hypothetical protein ACR2PJ_06110 [Pseudomonadales bacterium]